MRHPTRAGAELHHHVGGPQSDPLEQHPEVEQEPGEILAVAKGLGEQELAVLGDGEVLLGGEVELICTGDELWTLPHLWTHTTRPQDACKTAQKAVSHSAHSPSSSC